MNYLLDLLLIPMQVIIVIYTVYYFISNFKKENPTKKATIDHLAEALKSLEGIKIASNVRSTL